MTNNDEHRRRAAAIHTLIERSSDSTGWATGSDGPESRPDWQQAVVARILALTFDQDITYLSAATQDSTDWEIVAFTDATVVLVLISRIGGEEPLIETSSFPRSSLESLEVLDVVLIPADEEEWPSGLNLVGHYTSAIVSLPLDRFASHENQRTLARLLSSLTSDLKH